MVDSVTTLQTLLEKDQTNEVRELVAIYIRYKRQRATKEEEWKELRNYIFATDTSNTSNDGLPWRNKTHLPKIAQIRDNLHAQYMDALFPNEDWLIWDGEDIDSVSRKKRRTIETYTKNKAKASGLREVMSKLVYDYIDYGNCFAKVEWVHDKHFDPVLEEDVTTYMGPRVIRISPYDITMNPTSSSFEKSPKFVRQLKSVGELKKEIISKPDLGYDPKVLKQVMERRSTLQGYDTEDLDKAEGFLADGFGTMTEYLGSGLVEIIEYTGDIYDVAADTLRENRIITIIDRTFVLRDIENPNWLGSDGVVHVGWRDRPDNLWAMGPLDNLVGMQYRIDHLENLKADALDQTIFPPIGLKGEVSPFIWGPGVKIVIPEDGDVRPMPPNPAAFQVNNEIAFLMETMEEMAGSPKQSAGIRTPGEKTALEVQTLENNAGRIFHNKTSKFEILCLEKIMNLFLESAKRNLSIKDVIGVLDDDIGAVDFIDISREDIAAKGKLRPMGARHFAARSLLLQNLNGIFQGPLGAMLQPHTSAKALQVLIEELMGLSKHKLFKTNIGVAEQLETQKLVEQGKQTLQKEQTVPLEENLT
jgi:hypothetical protein